MVFPRKMDRTLLLFHVLRGGAAGTGQVLGSPRASRVAELELWWRWDQDSAPPSLAIGSEGREGQERSPGSWSAMC